MRKSIEPSAAQLKILNRLSAQKPAQSTASVGEPSPRQLTQLRQMSAQRPGDTGLWNEGKHMLASLLVAGPGHALQEIGQSALKGGLDVPGLGQLSKVIPGVLQEARRGAAPALDYNIPAHMGIPQTLPERLAQGLGGAIPAVGMAFETGGESLIPEIAGTIGKQAAYGAATTPQDPIGGGIESGLFAGLGSTAPVLAKLSKGAIKGRSMEALGNYLKSLGTEAKKGYEEFDKFAGRDITPTAAIAPHFAAAGVHTVEDVVSHLQSLKEAADLDPLSKDAMAEERKDAITKIFDPGTMTDFNNLKKLTLSHNAFETFGRDPTANNAVEFKKALSKDWKAGESSRNATLREMKDQLYDRVVYPFMDKNASSAQLEKFSTADMYTRQLKKLTGDSKLFDQMLRRKMVGKSVSPHDIKGDRYLNELIGAHLDGALDPPPEIFKMKNVPMKQYLKMQRTFGDIGHPLRGTGHVLGALGSKAMHLSPFLQTAGFIGQHKPS